MGWTMQAWTWALGNTAAIASGKPFGPSTTAMRMSCTPRSRSSFMTRSQNLAPSLRSIHRPSTSLAPSGRTPGATWTALLVAHRALVAHLHAERVEEDQGVRGLERPVLPLGGLVQHGAGHRADQVGRGLDAVQLAQVALDLARAYAAGAHRGDQTGRAHV